jgi:hypothetical protein
MISLHVQSQGKKETEVFIESFNVRLSVQRTALTLTWSIDWSQDCKILLLYLNVANKYLTFFFKDRMIVHRDKFLVNKTKRRIEFQFYWYYDCTCFGQPFCPLSGVLSRTSALVHFMQFDDRLLPGAGCSNADIRLRTPDDGQKGCPKHVYS